MSVSHIMFIRIQQRNEKIILFHPQNRKRYLQHIYRYTNTPSLKFTHKRLNVFKILTFIQKCFDLVFFFCKKFGYIQICIIKYE